MNITVDMTDFFSWTALMHFVRMFVVFNVAHIMFKDKYNSFVTFISVVGGGLVCSCISIIIYRPDIELLLMFMSYLVVTIALHLVTEGPILPKFLCPIIGITNNCLSSLLFSVFGKAVLGEDIARLFENEVPLLYFLSVVLFNLAFSYIFIIVIVLFYKKEQNVPRINPKYIIVLIFPITHIFTTIPVAKTLFTSTITDIYEIVNIFFIFQCLVLDMVLVLLVDYLDKIENEKVKKEKELLINTMELEQINMFKEEKQEFRKIKHDYANIISTAKGFIEIGKPEKALNILSNTNERIMGLAGFSVCANETLNTVLYIKIRRAKNQGLELNTEIDEQNAILIDEYDLCRLLHNVLDNCINAATVANNKKCDIKVEITDKLITITTQNGYDSSFNKKHKSSDSGEHGNGIGIIKHIVKKYNGDLKIENSNNIWITTVVLENTKPQK